MTLSASISSPYVLYVKSMRCAYKELGPVRTKQNASRTPARGPYFFRESALFFSAMFFKVSFMTIQQAFDQRARKLLTTIEIEMGVILCCEGGFRGDKFYHAVLAPHRFEHVPESYLGFLRDHPLGIAHGWN